MEIEHKEQAVALFKHNDLVAVVLNRDVLMRSVITEWMLLCKLVHVLLPFKQILEPQLLVVGEIPTTPGMVIAPPVACAGKIDPFRMTKFVAHESEVTLTSEAVREHADHLVQRDASLNAICGPGLVAHARVNFSVHQPHCDGLVSDHRLVVRLEIRNSLLVPAAIGHCVAQFAHVPIPVAALFQNFNKLVRDTHRQPVVKSNTSFFNRTTQCRHSRNVLSDGHHNVGVDGMQHLVRKHHVHARVDIYLVAKVLIVPPAERHVDAVVLVQHRSHPVEAEAVETVLVHPPPQVGQEETQHFPLAVVEHSRVPHRVIACSATMEILVVGAVKHGQAIHRV
mmetsp:Transcript_2709/g.7403  ORF Transcript_2709/g.7403 Transcript_2709/m.7403 type:complete len:338 (-) Transcript_2709:925-1938(-)